MELKQIGQFVTDQAGTRMVLKTEYAAALHGLEGFTHLQALWWFSNADDPGSRGSLEELLPYRHSPARLGVFATRSPMRPNPIALSCFQVTRLDLKCATVWVAYADADDGSPLLDLKPYTPSLDRVERPGVPGWCSQWPGSVETVGDFDWTAVFNF